MSTGEHTRAIDRIQRDMGLPPREPFQQDWEYELPDEYRTPAWTRRYIQALNEPAYDHSEQEILLRILLDCINDLFQSGNHSAEALLQGIKPFLRSNAEAFRETLDHWTLPGEPLEDAFALTARLRTLLDPASR